MKKLMFILFVAGAMCARGQGLAVPDTISAYPLSVTERFTTNLLFPSPIFRVDLGSSDVLAKKMGKTENVLLLKANRAGVRPTNVSVYLQDGRFYSFVVSYADSLKAFNYSFCSGVARVRFSGEGGDVARLDSDVVAMAARAAGGRFVRAKGSDGGVGLSLHGLYGKDGLLWMVMAASNRSTVDFEREGVRIAIEDHRRMRREAVQSVELEPVLMRGGDFLGGGRRMLVVVD
jgi:hypothetical protein